MRRPTGHVSSDRLGEAARHGGIDFLRDAERLHVETCQDCRRLYGGYRLTDRLLAAPWREVRVPAGALEKPRGVALVGRLGLPGFRPRALAPLAAVAAVVLLIGTAFALPQLVPVPAAGTATPSSLPPSVTGQPVSPVPSGQAATPTGQASGSDKAPSSTEPTPVQTAAPSPVQLAVRTVRIGGSPIAWAPDGGHLLVQGARIQVRDAEGRLGGSILGDAAAWYDSKTVAVASRSSSWRNAETIKLVDTGGTVVATLPGSYDMGGNPFSALLGSGSGELAIAGRGLDASASSGPGASGGPAGTPSPSSTTPGSSGWRFVLWNGKLSQSHEGVPIAFTREGRRLAVLHPGSVANGVVTGWLEIVAVPSLDTLAEYRGLSLRVGPGAAGSAYGLDAAFSPDGRYLLAGGVLVDASSGASYGVGKGGWLADGTLVTASADGLLRWRAGRSTPDPSFPGPGTVEASRHGELVYFYGDGRQPLFLDSGGTLYALSLEGVRSIEHLLIAPDGRTIALDGRATDGSSIAVVALPVQVNSTR